jgi:hypothetical protein
MENKTETGIDKLLLMVRFITVLEAEKKKISIWL